jgi:hypothetical protein
MLCTLTIHQFLKCFLSACSKALNTPYATAPPREPPPLIQVHFLLVLILYDEDGSLWLQKLAPKAIFLVKFLAFWEFTPFIFLMKIVSSSSHNGYQEKSNQQ